MSDTEQNDFAQVTQAKTEGIQEFIRQPATTRDIEQYLVENHGLRYQLAQVRYNFDPGFFRRESMDFNVLVRALSQNYGLFFKMPDIVRFAMLKGDDGEITSPNERLKEVLESPAGLHFLDGLLRYQDGGLDIERVIRIVNVHSQNLTVTVDGTSREAEFIAERIAGDLQVAQGMTTSRDSFRDKVAGKQYQTTTALRLGMPISAFFSRNFNAFVNNTIVKELGWKTSVLPSYPSEKQKENYEIAAAFHQIGVTVSTFDKESGDHETSELDIRVTDRRFYGSDLITVTSRLSADDHLVLVRELIRRVTGT